MRPADDSRGQRPGAVIHEFIEQGILSAEDQGDEGFGVEIKLQQGVDLAKDLDAHQVRFIDDQNGFLFFGGNVRDSPPECFGEESDREGTGFDLKGEQDLLE